MPDNPREYHVNHRAANELQLQAERARKIMERIAADLAATEPSHPDQLTDLVEQRHVLRAAQIFFGPPADRETLDATRATPDVFISYSTADGPFAAELAEDLRRVGVESFLAPRSVRTASDWVESIRRALAECRVFILVATPKATESEWCTLEIGGAWALNKEIVTVLRHVDVTSLPDLLQRLQAIRVETRLQQQELVRLLHQMCSG